MPIKTASIANHQKFIDVIQKTIKGIAPRSTFGHLDPKKLHATVPHTVYELGLTDLVAGAGLDKARPIAQRYLLIQSDQAVAAAEVAAGKDSPASKFAQLNDGPFVAGTQTAIAEAEQLPAVQRGDYELRLLRIPAVYVVALWLKPAAAGGDLLVPIAPVPPELVAGRDYAAADFLGALATRAADKLHFDQRKPPQ